MGKAKLVCIDTNVAIWGIKKEATVGQDGLIVKASWFIEKCQEEDTKIVLSAIALAELLSGVETEEGRVSFLHICRQHFIVKPFDASVALIFARMWPIDSRLKEELRQDGATRSRMKADCLIVATAIAAGVECIYSHDAGIGRLGEKAQLEVRHLPDVPPKQLGLEIPR